MSPARLDAEAIVAIWEQGRLEHPVDRALTVLSALSQRPRPELAELSIERRDALLFWWRARIFGDPLTGYAPCPRCGSGIEVSVAAAGLDAPGPEVGVVELGGSRVTLRMPNSVDLAAAARCTNVAEARRVLAERCTGAPVDTEAALAAVEAALVDGASASAVAVRLECPTCGEKWVLDVDIAAFLWRELEVLAGRLLAEVDVLARRYGWSEGQILGLSGARRRFYLELAS